MKYAPSIAASWVSLPETGSKTGKRSPSANKTDDGALLAICVRRAQNGDEDAWRELIGLYQKRIAGFVYAIVGRGDAVEDVSQQIFVKLVRSLSRLHSPAMFEPWLFRMARNTCFDYLRRQKLRRIFSPLGPEHEEHPDPPGFVSTEELDALRHALGHLRPSERALVALVQEGRSHAEIAEMFSTTASAVKSRLFRARLCILEHYQTARA